MSRTSKTLSVPIVLMYLHSMYINIPSLMLLKINLMPCVICNVTYFPQIGPIHFIFEAFKIKNKKQIWLLSMYFYDQNEIH